MNVDEMVQESHSRSTRKGWWTTPEDREIPAKLALVHSEFSEALEEYRRGRMEIWFNGVESPKDRAEWPNFVSAGHKPEGFVVEIADALIRICDISGWLEVPLADRVAEARRILGAHPFRGVGTEVAWLHNGISVALEAHRAGVYGDLWIAFGATFGACEFLCSELGLDLDEAIRLKQLFNETRAIRHGGRVI